MKNFYQLIVVACMFAVSSCCTMRTTSETVCTTPKRSDLIADLDVRSQKVNDTYVVKVKTKETLKLGGIEDDLKSNAVYSALKKIGADILVAPQFQVSKEKCNRYTTYTIEVSGYPAFYTNFRQMPIAEVLELRELKEGASYVVVNKSSNNKDLNYGEVIVVPVREGCNTLDLDKMTLEKVVLDGKNEKVKMCGNNSRTSNGKGVVSLDDDDKSEKNVSSKPKNKTWEKIKSTFKK